MIITTAMGRKVEVKPDYTVAQPWAEYTVADHQRWDRLVARQARILEKRVCPEFLDGLKRLKLSDSGIPNFEELSERLHKLTGWTVVAVPDLVPDEVFFEHLANRRFPAAGFIRDEAHLDYIEEPDAFHDIYGHVPLLSHTSFADFMQTYGQKGLDAAKKGKTHMHARLYWYTVEFGLIDDDGLPAIYGSGIVSSKGESVYATDSDSPHRICFDIERVMRTRYAVDDFQKSYFVISSYDELTEALEQDFDKLFEKVEAAGEIPADALIPGDKVITHGTQEHFRKRQAANA